MKKRLKNFSLFFISTVFALFLGEVIVRVFLPQNLVYNNDAIWKPDSKFGWRHHENINERVNFGGGEISFRTDENGFRVNADDRIDDDVMSQNVLVIGDSFMEAVQVENKNTLPEVLKRSLNEIPGVSTHFYNSGVAGWGPNHYFMEGQRVLEEGLLKIDQVLVFLYVANDMIMWEVDSFHPVNKAQNQLLRMPRNFDRREISSAIIYPTGDYLKRNSQLFMLFKKRNRGLLTKLGMAGYYFPDIFQKDNQYVRTWETTTRVCKKINDAFTAQEIPISFVLIPTNYQVNENIFEEYIENFNIDTDIVDLEQPNRILKERFARDSMQLYDPLYFFREKTKNGLALYGTVDTHFNAQGHEAMAEYLLPKISEQLRRSSEPSENR